MTTDTQPIADVVLNKRYPDAVRGEVHKFDGHLRRLTYQGWEATDAKADDILERLYGALGRQGLWRNEAARNIGVKLAIEAVEAARNEERA